MIDIEAWRREQMKLQALVKTLKRNTRLSELYELDKQHKGILLVFWRTYGNEPNFVNWVDKMEKKDPNWEEYYSNQQFDESKPKPLDNPVEIIEEDNGEEDIIDDEELSITEKIKRIQEKYGNYD